MEPLSGTAGLIQITQTIEAIDQIFRRYLGVGQLGAGWWRIQCLQGELAALSQTLEPLQRILHDEDPTQTGNFQDLLGNITKCAATVRRLRDNVDPETSQTVLSRWRAQPWEWPIENEKINKVIDELRRYVSIFWLWLMLNQMQSINCRNNQTMDLSRLHIAQDAAFNDSENRHTCLPGTQVELLRQIDHWIKSPDGKCLFWLTGLEGAGKSTVARTVLSCVKKQGLPGAGFFFQRGEQDRGSSKLLFSTLAKQLGDNLPEFITSIQRAIQDDPDISEKAPEEQFLKLILQPLIACNSFRPTPTILIVIDALDACDQDNNVREILGLLPRIQVSRSVHIRFLLTSRPDLPVRLGFQDAMNDHQRLMFHKIPDPAIEHDIRIYLKHEFLRLQQERDLPADWPGDQAINTLVERTTPSFISTTTLFRYISHDSESATERLEVILSDHTQYATKMEGIYMPVLDRLLTNEDEIHQFKNTVGVLIFLAAPLSVGSFAKLLHMEIDKVQKQFELFHPVLDHPVRLDEPVQMLHSSFRDFVLDNKQEGYPFSVDEGLVHKKLTAQCLQVMQHGLRKNICNLQNDTTPRQDINEDTLRHCLPSELRYACRYWVHHLVQSHNAVDELTQGFSFLQSHFLHWVEAMGLMGILSKAVEMIQRLRLAFKNHKNYELLDFVSDAWRFIVRHRHIAETTPLQVYSIGLIFTPEDSRIRRAFKNELSTWSLVPEMKERWNGQYSWLDSVAFAFSPDGRRLASGADDHTIKLWDPRTGELRQTLKGHSGYVTSVDFSPDSEILASASLDDTVRVWDSRTGGLCHTFVDNIDPIYDVSFSYNGELIGSGWDHDIVKTWDPRTGELLKVIE